MPCNDSEEKSDVCRINGLNSPGLFQECRGVENMDEVEGRVAGSGNGRFAR